MAERDAGHGLKTPVLDRPTRALIVVAPFYRGVADMLLAGARAALDAAGARHETVCNDSSRGLTLLGLDGLCIGNGILTVENRPQAEVRADPADQNKGGGAAAAALHLVALSRKWAGRTQGIGFRPQGESFRLAGETEGPSQA